MSRNRPVTIHVVLLDGTFASLTEGRRSSIGRIHALLNRMKRMMPAPGPQLRLYYGVGQQWNRWRTLPELAMGGVLERRIADAYGWLASGYQPGDMVFLFGYSRGAFAVRSLAGMIDRVGLLRAEAATERNVRTAWSYYRNGGSGKYLQAFRARRCQPQVTVRMLGCFDTVMALGVRLPLVWMLTEPRFRFHDAHLVPLVEYGFQALALDETRATFAPILWDDRSVPGRIEQRWFRGAHPDIGGQLSGRESARPLSNIPLVWMLECAESVGLPLPRRWRDGFPCDPDAPAIGSWRGWAKAFLARAPRIAGHFETETLHDGIDPSSYSGPALLVGHLAPKDKVQPARRRFRRRRRAKAVPPSLGESPEKPTTEAGGA